MIVIATPLTQWDTGRSVEIKNIVATHVHFANKGDSHAVIMALENSQAKIPDYLLQSGKELCVYAVSNGVTIERKSFFVTKRERPENYVYKEDQRNFVYKLITDAQEATEAANQATKDANEAADKANQAAKSWVIMGEAGGESMVIDDAIDQSFAGFRIFGKTTQDGVPTPDVPVELVSVENPTVTVNEQSMVVPYTLRGIPVSSGGNYTDANGQQWVCDEVDLARGVYVKRVGCEKFDGSTDEVWNTETTKTNTELFTIRVNNSVNVGTIVGLDFACTHFAVKDIYSRDIDGAQHTGKQFYFRISKSNLNTGGVSGFRAFLTASPMTVEYVLETPVEIPLSEEELAAYAALHTSRYGTTVTNDQDAYMDVQYQMDAKKYIDSLVGTSAGLVNATVE